MKHWVSYNLLVVLLLLVTMAASAMPAETEEPKRVLIINSYGERVPWSKDIVDSLEVRIRDKYPNWTICSGDMKTESIFSSGVAALTLRSVLWKYAEQTKTKIDATSLLKSSIFAQDDMPDAIVWVGEEAFLHYTTYALLLGNWKHIPMVLCAVKDSVSEGRWYPESEFAFDRKVSICSFSVVRSVLPASEPFIETLKKDKELRFAEVRDDGKKACEISVDLNYSGSIVKFPIRKNLELIHHLLPDLKELIWVDDDFYRSVENRLNVEKSLKEIMPDVKYSAIRHNRMNTDSIYDAMLEPVANRAFLTYGWNISGLHSHRSDREIDSLFTHVSTVPLFTLTGRDFSKDNYWIGGCYLDHSKIIDQTITRLDCAIRGDNMMTFPFDTVSESRIILNRTALERYNLTEMADKLEGVSYVHIPPAFYEKYEKYILIASLVLAIIVAYIVIARRRNRYIRRIKADYDRYKRLYDKLQAIYANSSIDFALYAEDGKCFLRIINGEFQSNENYNGLFCDNLFQNSFLSSRLRDQIEAKKTINCELSLDATGKLSNNNMAGKDVYQFIVKPLREINSRTSCFMAIAINLTPIIREREEKEKFESLFHFASDSSQVGVAFYDINTAVGLATNSWCQNLNETFISGTFPTYQQVMADDRAALLNFQQAVCGGDVQESLCKEVRVMNTDGNVHWIRHHMYFTPSSNRLVELSLNIDDQKQDEKRLEEAKVQAEKSNEETSCFLNSISHEVRTPLNAILGFSTVLTDLNDKESEKEFTPIVMRNIHLLDALITNILDLSALDAGKVSFSYTQINIAEMFVEMEEYIRDNLYEHPLQIVHELPASDRDRIITMDRECLRNLLINLLSNAMKFTEKGSVTMGCRKNSNGFYFYITDTGCGILPEDQQRIFDRFTKLDTYIQGTGLGLSLCKSIVRLFGGEIGVISEKGKGSTFWFVLPDKKEIE